MDHIKLSYIITTRNKLPYLKETLSRLVANRKDDEEIIIADGASTDGTIDFLEKLFKLGKIDMYISEPDKGEAHGYNKCFFMARGELIKIITDDDIFNYPEIQKCKNFMLVNTHIDVIGSEGAKTNITKENSFKKIEYINDHKKWLSSRKPFSFCGLSLMIRKKSLPLTGILDTSFLRVDAEFSLRITAGKSNIAWCSNICFIHVANQNSNTVMYSDDYYSDSIKLERIYSTKNQLYYYVIMVKQYLKNTLKTYLKKTNTNDIVNQEMILCTYANCDSWLAEQNKNTNNNFFSYDKTLLNK